MGGYQDESWVYGKGCGQVWTLFGVEDDLAGDDGVIERGDERFGVSWSLIFFIYLFDLIDLMYKALEGFLLIRLSS